MPMIALALAFIVGLFFFSTLHAHKANHPLALAPDRQPESGGRLVPALMTLTPEDEPEESTQIRYLELEFDPELPENTFSLSTLRKR